MNTNPTPFADFLARMARAPEDGTGAAPAPADAGAGDAPPAAAPAPAAPPGGDAPAPKWFATLPEDKQRVLASKGWNLDDPKDAAFKLLDHYTLAEKRLGKPADALIDRPAKDQKFTDWAKANGDVFGLPKDEAGYKVDMPKDFPKEMWNEGMATAAQRFAFENGVPPEIHQGYVNFLAQQQMAMAANIEQASAQATQELNNALVKEWGAGKDARMARARQTFQAIAAEAGLTEDGKTLANGALAQAMGDPAVMKLFDAIGAMMAEDRAVNIGGQPSGALSASEAKAQMDAMIAPDGELTKATANVQKGVAGAQTRLNELLAKQMHLAKLAAGTAT